MRPFVVELIADDDCAFDQPCRYGHRVEDHAVYCHNATWKDAPAKCRRTWYTGGRVRDEDCPGFEANQRGPIMEPETFNAEATQDAIAILNRCRSDVASGSMVVWQFLDHAAKHLEAQLTGYLREPEGGRT